MSEIRYTYKRVRLSNGTETYERVLYNPDDPVLEPPVIVPQHAPMSKNGEFAGMGSVVVDSLLAKTEAAQAKRDLRDAQDDWAEAERLRKQLGKGSKPEAPIKPTKGFGRIVEP